MESALSKIVAYMTFLFMFIVILINVMIKQDDTIEAYIRDETMEFTDECRTTGMISYENYKMFCETIYSLGDYDVEMVYEKRVLYSDKINNKVITRTEYVAESADDILSYMFPDDMNVAERDYPMDNGDMLTFKIVRNGGNIGTQLLTIFGVNTESYVLVVKYGGLVGFTTY